MWTGVTGSLGPCGGGGIAGMAVRSLWCLWAARVYRGAVMMWWACPSRTMWRSVPKSFGRWAVRWTVMWARARWWPFSPPSGACVRLSRGVCWCLFGFCHALRPPVPPVGPDPRLWGHILLFVLTSVIPLGRLLWANTMGFDRGYH